MERFEVQQIDRGLWRWTVPHPEWRPEQGGPAGWDQNVGCVYCETPDAVVLIDPLAPPGGTAEHQRFFEALDRDVERTGRPVVILLANHYHVRSAQEMFERYRAKSGAEILAHTDNRAACTVTRRFDEQDALAGEIRAFSIGNLNPGEVVFHLPTHRALVPADAIMGAGAGRLRLAPRTWAPEGQRERHDECFRAELLRLLDLPIDRVLVSHGQPVLREGAQALADALG